MSKLKNQNKGNENKENIYKECQNIKRNLLNLTSQQIEKVSDHWIGPAEKVNYKNYNTSMMLNTTGDIINTSVNGLAKFSSINGLRHITKNRTNQMN